MMTRMISKIATLGFLAAVAAVAASPASAQATLDTVKKRGKVLCGVSPSSAGYSFADDKGEWTGLDVDYCKALAAAVLGDAKKVTDDIVKAMAH